MSVSQFDYYVVLILLGVGNLALAAIAYRQRDKQIQGNQLRETQVELAELRNEMAQKRMEYLGAQNELLREIRDALADGDGRREADPDVARAGRSFRRGAAA
jgi:hypothetical protein